MPLGSITVYCSSSNRVAPAYFDAARCAGRALAENRWSLVYGGNSVGLMKALADAARAAGGRVIGITPRLMVDKNLHDTLADELVITHNMRDRKALLEARGDGFLTLPGGLGTLEEIFEIIVGKQLGYHNKPIVLLNVNGYFAPLLRMIENGIEQQFIKPRTREIFFVADAIGAAIDHFKSYRPPALTDKWRNEPPSAVE